MHKETNNHSYKHEESLLCTLYLSSLREWRRGREPLLLVCVGLIYSDSVILCLTHDICSGFWSLSLKQKAQYNEYLVLTKHPGFSISELDFLGSMTTYFSFLGSFFSKIQSMDGG